ncbi:MAG: esterase-like activity of phytase family protein [Cyanobacteriota bacterium]|nr:esterase-like activity of phytase family protein [Cyanobacteriota bacterium]
MPRSWGSLRSLVLVGMSLSLGTLAYSQTGWTQTQPIKGFQHLTRYVVGGAVAEIIAASPDGNTLAFTNAGDQQVGFVDITDPADPKALGTVAVEGEPTSVAITPDGQVAIVALLDLIDDDKKETIADQKPGKLIFIDLSSRTIQAELPLPGIGPDSLAITPDGKKVVVAIEDEEDTDNLPGQRPGSITIVTLNSQDPAQSEVANLTIDLSQVAGANYPTDPQPEYVAISPDGKTAAVTLQENNAIALVDLAGEKIIRIFSAGTSQHAKADLTEDGEISLTQAFEGRREPDTIAFTPDGNYLVTLNEGDTDLESFGDNIWSGGRGWSIFDREGTVVYDSDSRAEEAAVLRGHYPEGRSENRGIEMEGGDVERFGNQDLAFVASERGSFLIVADITEPQEPRRLAFLPTGLAPEGILALPKRNLVLASNEGDGTIDIWQASPAEVDPYSEREPLVVSESLDLPFSALSGLQVDAQETSMLYAVPDSAIAPSRIYSINLEGNRAKVSKALILTKNNEPVAYDLEGITLAPQGGFWLVSEGDDREGQEKPNILIRVDDQGSVQEEIFLPESDAQKITRFGFEGVATNADGSKVYVAVQREFKDEEKGKVRIAEYDLTSQTWAYYFYPLDSGNVEDSWVGLSEIARQPDGSFLILERDNQGGVNGAANARIKRVYRISLEGVKPGETLDKTLVSDLLKDHNWLEEKAEGLTVTEKGFWVASDNDGGETYSRLLLVSP